MNAKKQREKNRRHANKLAEEAWQAAEDDRIDLAIKIMQRAIDLNPGNPMLWHDRGSLLAMNGNDGDAASAFQAALQLAPEFADAFAALAAIHARHGRVEQAVPLQREAVRFARHPEQQQKRLAAYEAMLAADIRDQPVPLKILDDETERQPDQTWPDLTANVERLDWAEIGDGLREHGFTHVANFLDAESCETLRLMFADDRRFAKTVTMNKNRFGRGVYRYFAAPVPPLIEAVRRLVYPGLAEIANGWQRLLGHEERYPAA